MAEFSPPADLIRCVEESLTVRAVRETSEELYQRAEALRRYAQIQFLGNNPEETLKSLQQASQGSVCGHLFQRQEPTYRCRDCEADATCVFCYQCFRQSEHRHHNYSVGRSNGGGYCDCGDREAWKQHYACAQHASSDNSNPIESIPQDIRERAERFLHVVMAYCTDVLSKAGMYGQAPGWLQEHAHKDHACILYNDEDHNMQDVISYLAKYAKMKLEEAQNWTEFVDRWGMGIILVGTTKDCSTIAANLLNVRPTPLRSLSVSVVRVQHHLAVCVLLRWLKEIADLSAGLRSLICAAFLKEVKLSAGSDIAVVPGEHNAGRRRRRKELKNPLQILLLSEPDMWRGVREDLMALYLSSMLLDPIHKRNFAEAYTSNFYFIQEAFIYNTDLKESSSVVSLPVQFLSVPSVVAYLSEKYHVQCMILDSIRELLKPKLTDGEWPIDCDESPASYGRYLQMLLDVEYVLRWHPLAASQVTRVLRQEVYVLRQGVLPPDMDKFITAMLNFLCYFQEMNPQERKTGAHVEYEDYEAWMVAFQFYHYLGLCLPLFCDLLCKDPDLCLSAVQRQLRHVLDTQLSRAETEPLGPNWPNVTIVSHSVLDDPVSVHLPLHRTLMETLLRLHSLDREAALLGIVPPSDLPILLEGPLRIMVFLAQLQANMWVRNGDTVRNIVHNYVGPRYAEITYDLDLMLLQFGLAQMDPKCSMALLIRKYGLDDWLEQKLDRPAMDGAHKRQVEEEQHVAVQIAEQLLLFIVALVYERTPALRGMRSDTHAEREWVRRDMIHRLAIHPYTYSALVAKLNFTASERSDLNDILQSISTSTEADGVGESKKYQLLPELFKEVCPFYYHYSSADREKISKPLAEWRKKNQNAPYTPIPTPSPVSGVFTPLGSILRAPTMLRMLFFILSEATNKQSIYVSATLVYEALYVLMVGLILDEADNTDNAFAKALAGYPPEGIMPLMQKVKSTDHGTEHGDLIGWLVQRLTSVLSLAQPQGADTDMQTTDADTDKEERRRKSRQRQMALMAQMAAAQKKFMDSHAHLAEEGSPKPNQHPSQAMLASSEGTNWEMFERRDSVDSDRPAHDETLTCILCQETSFVREVDPTKGAFGLVAYLVPSAVLHCINKNILGDKYREPEDINSVNMFVNGCGHPMHHKCKERYCATQDQQRLSRHYPHIEKQGEFFCPLCKSIANTLVPYPGAPSSHGRSMDVDDDSLQGWAHQLPNTNPFIVANGFFAPPQVPIVEGAEQRPDSPIPMSTSGGGTPSSTPPIRSFGGLVDFLAQRRSSNGSHSAAVPVVLGFNVMCRREGLTDKESICRSVAYTVATCELATRLNPDNAALMSGRKRELLHQICNTLLAHHKPALHNQPPVDIRPLLDRDVFLLLVQSQFYLPETYTAVGQAAHGHQMVSLLHLVHVVQLLLFVAAWGSEALALAPKVTAYPYWEKDADAVQRLFANVWSVVSPSKPMPQHDSGRLHAFVTGCSMPFLQRAATFLRILLPSLADEELTHEDEYHMLGAALHLPPLATLLGGDYVQARWVSDTVRMWCTDWIKSGGVASPTCIRPATQHQVHHHIPLRLRELFGPGCPQLLAPLPNEHSELLYVATNTKCAKCGTVPPSQALCLACGTLLCVKARCCQLPDRTGECTVHARRCGGGDVGTGMFYLVDVCHMLLLHDGRGCVHSISPYVDSHGEAASAFKRGQPLFLSGRRMGQLVQMWLRHEVLPTIVLRFDKAPNLYDWRHY